ncbi:unnamed protein product [Gongylonema pulchrum]|uniref:Uncharacterized protein n=1 Tax=Gongylonema pulchrum TaxID=637853 RepID=A0A183E6G5_9BILA|nr:unnamed protein product [Gongylonema pulchrum]
MEHRASATDQADGLARRRRTTSLGKLSQFFQNGNANERSGAASLHSALADLTLTGKLMTKVAETQNRGMASLTCWAHCANNAAIDDVMQRTSQLFDIFTERQLQFVRHYTHYVQQLQKIEDAERVVKLAERNVEELDEKEKKLRREIQKGVSFFRQRRGGDIYLLRQTLEQVLPSPQS